MLSKGEHEKRFITSMAGILLYVVCCLVLSITVICFVCNLFQISISALLKSIISADENNLPAFENVVPISQSPALACYDNKFMEADFMK